MKDYDYKIPFLDTYKSFSDYFKHITTLDTGAILIIVAFIEKAFKHPTGNFLIILAFICFVLSLICSVSTMFQYARLISEEEARNFQERSKFSKFLSRLNFRISKYGFIIGMILLALYGIVNIMNGYSSWMA